MTCNTVLGLQATLFWILQPWQWDRYVIPKRRYEINHRSLRNNPEERSSQLLRGGA
jgi:hypothetical protein